jgi:hypothetical protein
VSEVGSKEFSSAGSKQHVVSGGTVSYILILLLLLLFLLLLSFSFYFFSSLF